MGTRHDKTVSCGALTGDWRHCTIGQCARTAYQNNTSYYDGGRGAVCGRRNYYGVRIIIIIIMILTAGKYTAKHGVVL